MWLKLLQLRTKGSALEIVQESRGAQEMIGAQGTVDMIWRTFEEQYAAERNPGQDLLDGLMSGTNISESDPKLYWKFVHQCKLAAAAMEYNNAVKSILSVKQNQEKIAKRLGESSFKEWTFYRQKQMKKNKNCHISDVLRMDRTKSSNNTGIRPA